MNTYKINYLNTKETINNNPINYSDDDLPITLKPLEHDFLNFIGWMDEDEKIILNIEDNKKRDIYLYAIWEEKSQIIIDFNKNTTDTVSNTPAPISISQGFNITIPDDIPKRNGYIFLNWNTKKDNTGDKIYPKQELKELTEDMTLYAIWYKIPQIKIPTNITYRCICCKCQCKLKDICPCDCNKLNKCCK